MLWASQMYLLYFELLIIDHIENLNSYFWCYWIKQPLPEEEERGEMVDPKVEGLNIRSLNSQHTTSVMWRVLPQCVLFVLFLFFKENKAKFTSGISGCLPHFFNATCVLFHQGWIWS